MGLINPQLQSLGAALVVKAVRDLFPQAKFSELRITNLGFRCHFLFHQQPKEGFLEQLTERCRSLLTTDLNIKFHTMIPENASEFLLHHHEPLQSNLAHESNRQFVTVLQVEDVFVFCEEPDTCALKDIQGIIFTEVKDIPSSHKHKFEITIQGAAFASLREKKTFQKKYDKYKRGNHISQGEQNQMLLFQEVLTENTPSWLAKGTAEIQRVWTKIEEELAPLGYETIITPTLIRNTIWKNGLDPVFIYGELFLGEPFLLRPSMIPAHIAVGMERIQAGKFPIRLAEFGKIYQNIPLDDLYGSINNPEHLMDMQTIFCKKEDGLREIISSLQLIVKMITMFGIPFRWVLLSQARDKTEKRKGQDAEKWDLATSLLQEALSEVSYEFRVETTQGLSGPCIETRFTDSLEREWSGSFIEINLTLPRLLQSGFGKDHFEEMPMIIHRSLVGPVDRVISLKIENT